jgi:small subunit ribosomal protein S1
VTLKKVSKVSKASKEPQTMEELLASSKAPIKRLKRGEQFEGIVKNIASKTVYIDIGAKSYGVVAGREYDAAREFVKNLKIDDKIMVSIASPEDSMGQILLSLKKAAFSSAWKKYLDAQAQNTEVEVLVKEQTQAGLLIDCDGLSGFIPTSQIGKIHQGKTSELINKKIRVKVLEIDQVQNRLLFSEKAVSEKEKIARLKTLLGKIEVNTTFEGEVTSILPFGVFVKIMIDNEEIEGLVHISEVSWEKIADAQGMFDIGEKVKVVVIGKDEEAGRLSFSLKQTTDDPWQNKIKNYSQEKQVKGKVLKLIASGAVIGLEDGVEGFLHISKIPPTTKIDVGDTLDLVIEKIEAEKRRISLDLVLKAKPMGYK